MLSIAASSFAGVFYLRFCRPSADCPFTTQPYAPVRDTSGRLATGHGATKATTGFLEPGSLAPEPGFLWTPGYWGWGSGAYVFNAGYWGPHVGFYGGMNYGFGYAGSGYYGGEWRGRNFYYNRSVNNVNVTNVTNVYNKTVIVNNNNHVSLQRSGNGGIQAEPNAQQQPVGARTSCRAHAEPAASTSRQAARNPQLLASNNGGKPGDRCHRSSWTIQGRGVVGARAAGGHVDPEALNASPKNMPARNANEGRVNDARANGGRTNEGTARGTNVPRPPNATNERGAATANASPRNVPKPNNAPRAETSPNNTRENGNARNVPKPPSASNNSRRRRPLAPPQLRSAA